MNDEGHELGQQTPEGKADDLKLRFTEMVANIKKTDPKDRQELVSKHQDIFQEVFGASNEKLAIFGDEFYFFDDDKQLTNFGAVVLNVTHIHEIGGKRYDIELLILSQLEKGKIVSVDSLSLRSGLWIEKINASFWYEQILSIQKAIKRMTEFAPSTKVYNYSGWAIDEPDTYLLGSQKICAMKSNISEPYKAKAACEYVWTLPH